MPNVAAWASQPYEKLLVERLEHQLGPDEAAAYFARYQNMRNALPPTWEQIRGTEPFLSDHGPRHIQNVLENAHALVSHLSTDKQPTGIDLYCLGLAILIHDVGNVLGRNDHENLQRLSTVYDQVMTGPPNHQEKGIVIRIAHAHTGKARDGTKDTLKDFDTEPTSNLQGKPVKIQEIAALLRIADELAEGPQRTVEFMRHAGQYPDTAAAHHEYASVTNIGIDPGNERIAITYNIPFTSNNNSIDTALPALRKTLEFIFGRLQKLDQERKYARFYSTVLPFKSVRAKFDFWLDGHPLLIDLPPLELNDKTIPGDQCKAISHINPLYDINSLLSAIQSAANNRRPPNGGGAGYLSIAMAAIGRFFSSLLGMGVGR